MLTLSEVASTLTLAPVTKLSTIRLRAGQGLELSLECVQGMFFSADYSDVLIAYKEFPRNQKWLPQDWSIQCGIQMFQIDGKKFKENAKFELIANSTYDDPEHIAKKI